MWQQQLILQKEKTEEKGILKTTIVKEVPLLPTKNAKNWWIESFNEMKTSAVDRKK